MRLTAPAKGRSFPLPFPSALLPASADPPATARRKFSAFRSKSGRLRWARSARATPPDPAKYGLDAADYVDLIIETRADAEAAVALFIRDAGLKPDDSITADPLSVRRSSA